MKINRIVFPLMLALIATMAPTGCNKKAPKVTPLPGQVAPIVDNQNASTLPPGQTTDSSSGVGKAPGNLATTGLDEFEGMIKDKGALAAYTIHYKFDSAV